MHRKCTSIMENYYCSSSSQIKEILINYNLLPHFIYAFPPYHSLQFDKFIAPKLYNRSCLVLALVLCMMTIDLTYLWLVVAPTVNREAIGARTMIDFYLHATSRTFGCFMAWQFFWNMSSCIHLVNLLFRLEKYFEGKLILFFKSTETEHFTLIRQARTTCRPHLTL